MNLLRKVLVVFSVCLTLLLLSRYISFLPSGIDEDGDGHSGGEASGLWGEYDTHISVQSKQINNVVFIFGLGGSGTRGVTSLFELWGCSIKFYKLNPALDNTLVFKLNPYVDDILNITGSADYRMDELPHHLTSRIDATMVDIKKVIHHVVLSRCVVVKWPRIIYLLPVLKHHFPDSKFVQVVRDGRDMVLSKNQLQYREFSRFYITAADKELSKPFRQLRFWYLLNQQAKHWLQRNAKEDSTVLRIESLVLEADERVYQGLYNTSLSHTPPQNLSANEVFETPIANRRYNTTKYGKFKSLTRVADRQLLSDLESMFRDELEEFGYNVTSKKT